MTPTDQPTLKPCPFCGENPCGPFPGGFPKTLFVKCKNHNCELNHKDGGFTIEDWNHRPLEDKLRAENARLKEINKKLCWAVTSIRSISTNPTTNPKGTLELIKNVSNAAIAAITQKETKD